MGVNAHSFEVDNLQTLLHFKSESNNFIQSITDNKLGLWLLNQAFGQAGNSWVDLSVI